MAILIDARASKSRDMLKSFINLNGHEGSRVYFQPNQVGKSDYFQRYFGLPRRFFYGPHPVTKKGAWWAYQPKVSQTAPRAEGAFTYESAIVTRFFYWKIHLPSTGPMAFIDDTTGYQAIVGQWHENKQPNGARPPPFEVAIYYDKVDGKRKMKATIAHDDGTGTSGSSTYQPTLQEFPLGDLPLDQDIEFAVRIKAEGTNTDFVQIWVNGVLMADYSGNYIGYPYFDGSANYPGYTGAGNYAQQNFFKIGTYYYQQHGSPTYRAICQLGLLVGDQNETLASMRAKWDEAVPVTSHTRTRVAVAVLGGTNVLGVNSGAVNRALYGRPCVDPVEPAVASWASLVPALSSRLSRRGVGAVVYNCAKAGVGMTSLSGRCRGTWSATTAYVPGDIITPSVVVPTYDPVGNVNNRLENGLCFVCEVGGTSGATEPNWATLAAAPNGVSTGQNVAFPEGAITWRAERRESYHTAGKIFQFGDLGFDPLGLVSQALMCVDQTLAADRKILMLMPNLDASQNTATDDVAAAIASVTALANQMGIEVLVSTQTVSGTVDDGVLGVIGKAAANEIILP